MNYFKSIVVLLALLPLVSFAQLINTGQGIINKSNKPDGKIYVSGLGARTDLTAPLLKERAKGFFYANWISWNDRQTNEKFRLHNGIFYSNDSATKGHIRFYLEDNQHSIIDAIINIEYNNAGLYVFEIYDIKLISVSGVSIADPDASDGSFIREGGRNSSSAEILKLVNDEIKKIGGGVHYVLKEGTSD